MNNAAATSDDSSSSSEDYASDGFVFTIYDSAETSEFEEENPMSDENRSVGVESKKDIFVSENATTSAMVDITLTNLNTFLIVPEVTVEDINSDSELSSDVGWTKVKSKRNSKDIRSKIRKSSGGSADRSVKFNSFTPKLRTSSDDEDDMPELISNSDNSDSEDETPSFTASRVTTISA